jgi:hypothetical protein
MRNHQEHRAEEWPDLAARVAATALLANFIVRIQKDSLAALCRIVVLCDC